MAWGVMRLDTYVVSDVVLATSKSGAVATSAEVKKSTKYGELARTHHVASLEIETPGVFGPGSMGSSPSRADE